MRKFFQMNGPVFDFLGKVADILILNLLWLLTSLPIITIGASTSALFSVTILMVKEREGNIFQNYFAAFKRNFKRSTIVFVIAALVAVVLSMNIYFWANTDGTLATGFWALSLGLSFLYLITLFYVFTIQDFFNLPALKTIKTSFLIAGKHVKQTLYILFIVACMVILNTTIIFVNYMFIIIGIGLTAYLMSRPLLKVLSFYQKDDEVTSI